MAQEQTVARIKVEGSDNPMEAEVYNRIHTFFKEPEERELYAVRAPLDDKRDAEVKVAFGKFAPKANLQMYSTFGSGGTQIDGKVTHKDSSTDEATEYDFGIEFWTLSTETAEKKRGEVLGGLATLTMILYLQEAPLYPGLLINLPDLESRFKHVLLLDRDPVHGTELQPVIVDGRAIHFVYVLPLDESEVVLTKSLEGFQKLDAHLKSLGNKAFSSNRPVCPPLEDTDVEPKEVEPVAPKKEDSDSE